MIDDKKKELDKLLSEKRLKKVSDIYYSDNHIDNLFTQADKVTDTALSCLLDVLSNILRYKNPYLDEPKEKRKASLFLNQKDVRYSEEIRKSTSESVAAIYNNIEKFHSCDAYDAKNKISKRIAAVFGENWDDWKFWKTNEKILAILATIDSVQYVSFVNKLIDSDTLEMLMDEGVESLIYQTGNPLQYILNSLEYATYASEAYPLSTNCILKLAQNYPASSDIATRAIKTIVNPYNPLTTYPENSIPEVLIANLKDHRGIRSIILRELLPFNLKTYVIIKPPKYLRIETRTDGINRNYFKHFKAYTEEYIKSINRYSDLLQLIEDLPYISIDSSALQEKIQNLCTKYQNDELKNNEIWQKLYLVETKIENSYILNAVQRAKRIIEPKDEIEKNLILFDNSEIDLMDRKIKDYSKQEEEISNKRVNALEKIYKSKGKAGIEELVERTKNASRVAFSLAKSSQSGLFEKDIEKALSDTGSQKKKEFIEAYIWYMFILNDKTKWLSRINYEDFNQSVIKKLLLLVQSNKDIWQIVQERKIDEYYWQKIKIDAYGSWTENELEYIIKKLNEHKRQSLSINFIAIAIYRKKAVDSQLIFDTLSSFDGNPSEEYREALNIETVLEYYQITEKDESKLIAIELKYINYFPKYQNKLRPTNLIKALAKKPELFCMVYDQVFSERKDNYAFYKIVHDYYIQPGLGTNNKRTKKSVDDWVNAVEKYYSANNDRLKCAKSIIGQNMATDNCYKPQDDEAILKFLNNCDEDYRRGFIIGVANSRDVIHVDEQCSEDNKLINIWEQEAQRLDKKGLMGAASLFRSVKEDFRINIKYTKDMLGQERIS